MLLQNNWSSNGYKGISQKINDYDFRSIVVTTHVKILEINRTGASPGTFFTVSGTARMVPAEASKMLIGSKSSVPVDKTVKAALL